ncbi:hypothetical protein A6R68_23746, partial [Neotoma lepida]
VISAHPIHSLDNPHHHFHSSSLASPARSHLYHPSSPWPIGTSMSLSDRANSTALNHHIHSVKTASIGTLGRSRPPMPVVVPSAPEVQETTRMLEDSESTINRGIPGGIPGQLRAKPVHVTILASARDHGHDCPFPPRAQLHDSTSLQHPLHPFLLPLPHSSHISRPGSSPPLAMRLPRAMTEALPPPES